MPQAPQEPPKPASAGEAISAVRQAPIDILVVVPHLGAGGTQRVVSLLLNHWHDHGRRVALITLFPNPDAYRIAPDIPRNDFELGAKTAPGISRLRQANYELDAALQRLGDETTGWRAHLGRLALDAYRALRNAAATVLATTSPALIERVIADSRQVVWLRARIQAASPRVVLSFLGATNIQTVLAANGLGIPVLISERNDPAMQRLEQPWQTLRTRVYPRADRITANSAGALTTLARHVPREKLRQVHNPLRVPACPLGLTRHTERVVLVARLVEQKGVDLIVDAFARVAAGLRGWHLDLVGDGPLRPALEARVRRAGLQARVTFHGHQDDPFPFLFAGSVFALPSRFEGMPNAMLEAMGAGLAIIVSDASPGPLELIRDGETGLVFPSGDSRALAKAITRLCAEPALRRRLGGAAQALAETMSLPRVAADWERLMAEAGASLAPLGEPTAHG